MIRMRNSQQRKEPETMASATELTDMDIRKMSDIEFRVALMKSLARLEKSICDNIESLRAEMRSNCTELKNAMKGKRSKLDTLKARANKKNELMI